MEGDFRINEWLVQPQANSVEKDGKTWHLEPKIMQVLVELAEHRNEVLSKERLLEAVWHNTYVGEDALVRCISEIRNVFGDEPKSSRVIQTIPKTGYRLIATVTTEGGTSTDSSPSVAGGRSRSGVDLQPASAGPEHSDSNGGKASPASVVGELLHKPTPTGDSSTDRTESVQFPTVEDRVPSRNRLKSIVALTSLVVLLACLGLSYLWKSTQRSSIDRFWEPILSGNDPVVLCIADQLQNSQISLRDAADPRRLISLKDNLVSVALDDMGPIMKIGAVLQSHGKPYALKSEGATTLADLKSGPAVFIGAFDNAWTLRLTNPLRFHFWNDAAMTQLRIVDGSDPAQTHWLVDRSVPLVNNSYRDYAIVARFTDTNTGELAVVIAGIGSGGTIAAGEFVTNANGLVQLMRAAQAAGEKKNLEVVLSTQVIDGHPGSSKIEAAYFW
jgi:DNA-binding winged helix-turn-helix (wHTH) protein